MTFESLVTKSYIDLQSKSQECTRPGRVRTLACRIGLLSCTVLAVAACGALGSPDFRSSEGSASDYGIVGGADTTISENPWQVSLQTSSGIHFCGGSVLSSTWILTANHCIIGSAAQMQVAAGMTHLSSSSAQVRKIEQVIPYPGFIDPMMGKDVALLKLSVPLDLSGPNVKSIPIMTDEVADDGATAEGVVGRVTGWGTLSSGGSSPDTLQTVSVPIITNEQAQQYYPEEIITEDQLGAAYLNVGGQDACQGDSGGPLTVSTAYGRALAGVVSWGYGCAEADRPGMYARVSYFQGWLYANTDATLIGVDNLYPEFDPDTDPDLDPTPDPDPDPDPPTTPASCGYNPAHGYYHCGASGEDPSGMNPIACPSHLEAHAACGDVTYAGCCDAKGDNWYCDGNVLVKNPCDAIVPDPDPLPGCGFTASSSDPGFYVCGGNGADPSGLNPIDCPPNLQVGGECGDVAYTGCCDAQGNNWFCVETLQKETCG